MDFPIQIIRSYVNPFGNLLASGLYRSFLTQELANDFPDWMDLRNINQSVGQQLIASEAILLEWLQRGLEYNIRSKFLETSPVDDIDVLYTIPLPANINPLNIGPSGLTVVASGYPVDPSGYFIHDIVLEEVSLLEDFYYNVLPTRMEIVSSGNYQGVINNTSWNIIPSGIVDKESKLYDIWRNKHDLTWCSVPGTILKQDARTMETYESYTWDDTGTVSDMWYNHGLLWCLATDAGGPFISILSSKTQIPQDASLDYLARFNFPSGIFTPGTTIENIMIDKNGYMWVADAYKISTFGIAPRYDYFINDPTTRSIYMRENYGNVFISV